MGTEHDSRTIWCGNLPEEATEELLYELFLQAGPLEFVKIARDKDGRKRNFGFITYRHEVSVPYALQLFKNTTLFKRQLNLQARGGYRPPPPPPPVHRPQPIQSTYEIPQKLKDMRNEFKLMTQELVNKENNLQTQLLMNISNEDDDLTAASLQGNWSHRHHPYHKEYNKNRKHEPSRSHRSEQGKHYRNDNRQHHRDDREEEHHDPRSYNNTHLQRPRNNKSNSGYRRRR